MGMAVTVNSGIDEGVSHAITFETLNEYLTLGVQRRRSVSQPPECPGTPHERPRAEKRDEIASYLRSIADALPVPNGDVQFLGYAEPILCDGGEQFRQLRLAFGFPAESDLPRCLYRFASSDSPAVLPFVSVLAQRMNHLFWRFTCTLRDIGREPGQEWAASAKEKAEAIADLCKPHLIADQPTLSVVIAALSHQEKLSEFSESAPDATLYAVLRAIEQERPGDEIRIPPEENKRKALAQAMDFIERFCGTQLLRHNESTIARTPGGLCVKGSTTAHALVEAIAS